MSAVSLRLGATRAKKSACTLAVILLLALLTACGGANGHLSLQPFDLPFSIDYSPPNHWSIEGDKSFATPIGQFSIGAEYELPQNNSQSMYVILRNRRTGYDQIFDVKTGGEQFTAVVNGTTIVSVTNDQVLIDVTNGHIERITFKRANTAIAEVTSTNWFASTWHSAGAKWDEGWSQSWYKPFSLGKWAYDDSTIDKWYGAGFVLFLLRFVFAIALFIVDLILTFGFLFGQLGFMIFGPTGRDAIYGIEVLVVLFMVIAGIAAG
jgi:hypothetical protein